MAEKGAGRCAPLGNRPAADFTMTLTRTIQRREKRKRAKLRAAQRQSGMHFLSAKWLVKDHLTALSTNLRLVHLFSREYK